MRIFPATERDDDSTVERSRKMLTRQALRGRIQNHLDGATTLEDLAAWAEEAFRTESFEPGRTEDIQEVLAVIRDAVDPHRFRWEEPDFEALLQALAD